jgi:23S rRNA pseudouridine2604 synthase
MGELDLCSRREADRLILEGCVRVDGRAAEIGEKVPSNLTADRIEIISENLLRKNRCDEGGDHENEKILTTDGDKNVPLAIVLNKPVGFVSGQAEHGCLPAIRLLKASNLWNGNSTKGPVISTSTFATNNDFQIPDSWIGFAPAGRLDKDSSGLLVFSRSGVIAKKLIGSNSTVEKEYIVHVEPAVQPTRREHKIDPNFELPTTTLDLTPLLRGGGSLLGDGNHRPPLKPCADASWIREGEVLKIVLTEGRKHHIRRAAREILGWHVKHLRRVRIGPICLEELPEGRWRPLQQQEVEGLLAS